MSSCFSLLLLVEAEDSAELRIQSDKDPARKSLKFGLPTAQVPTIVLLFFVELLSEMTEILDDDDNNEMIIDSNAEEEEEDGVNGNGENNKEIPITAFIQLIWQEAVVPDELFRALNMDINRINAKL